MTPAPVTTPDGALSRATSSPHAKTAAAVDLLPHGSRQPYTATGRSVPEPRTKGRENTLVLRGRARSWPAIAGVHQTAQASVFVTAFGGGEGRFQRPAEPPPKPDIFNLARRDVAAPAVVFIGGVVALAGMARHRPSSLSPAHRELCVSQTHSANAGDRGVGISSREFGNSSREIGAA